MAYKYKFQGQERQDELGLNWDSFKWRNYDYAIARFMSIDPLAEKYEDYTPYQFSSNQPVHANEVEGLESSNDLNKKHVGRALSIPKLEVLMCSNI
jgi:RHS repeat-associated core domain